MATATLSQPSPAARAITIDAIFCAISGATLALFNGALADDTGIPALVLLVVGLATGHSYRPASGEAPERGRSHA